MLFNSLQFCVFLGVVLALHSALKPRQQLYFLLASSYFFYGSWDWRFLSLMLLSTAVDYTVAILLAGTEDPVRRKRLLWTSVAVNLSVLGFFKYFGFFVGSATALLDTLGLHTNPVLLHIVLPVGISFYTFQTMSYTIDVYRRRTEPERDLLTFALFVAWFPQLVAGPIERAQRLMPQLKQRRRVDRDQVVRGFALIVTGLFRKVAIADAVAPYVDMVFAKPSEMSILALIGGLYLFALQIYGDFSGYSRIARGVSLLFGVELMRNFEQPYLSANITDFWRRWHISLSQWLRDYLYITLGGNRLGELKTYRNLMTTMLLGGLWHGAAWTFVVWGGLHGTFLAVHKMWRGDARKAAPTLSSGRARFLYVANVLLTFHLVCLTWLFFRAPDFSIAAEYLASMFLNPIGGSRFDLVVAGSVLVYGGAMLALDVLERRTGSHTAVLDWSWPTQGVVAGFALVFLVMLGGIDANVPFIYFQF